MTQQPVLPQVTDDTFPEEVLAATGPVLVDVWAPWCQPCHKLTPVLGELAADLTGRLRIVGLEADENPDTVRHYGVESLPTMLLFRDGQLVTSLVGARPKPDLATRLRELIA